ncbi:MAG: thioredoxin family protein [Calditrichia bacterium]
MALNKIFFLFLILVALPVFAGGSGHTDNPDGPYDESANAREEITAAVQKAQENNQHVLLVFGANWCPWCRALHNLFTENKQIRQLLDTNFQVVLVDIGRKDKNMDVDSLYGNPVKMGVPALVVLNSAGEQVALQETGSLEWQNTGEKGHDPKKVAAFLMKFIE